MIAAEPDEAARRLGELENHFLAMDAPPDDPARRPLWSEMARLNAAFGCNGDAALCWANALWEGDDPPLAWAESWADAEFPEKRPADPKTLDRLLAVAKPNAADLRTLAAALVRAAEGGGVPSAIIERLGRVQPFLERHEATIPVRIAWLAWGAVARLAGNDALALARARDRVLERLHQRGLSRELDLPAFLRVAGTGAGDRARSGREHLFRLVEPMRSWIERGPWVGPYTRALADLVLAFGLARVGDADGAGGLVREGLGALKKNDAVVGWLGRAFDRRVGQALEGKAEGPLPADLMAQLDGMGQSGDGARQRDDKISRYKIDRIREHSRILEPLENVDPYRHWHSTLDEVARELVRVVDLVDRDELAERMGKLLRVRASGASAAVRNGQVLRTALDVGFRLGEGFAVGLFDRVGPTVDRLEQIPRRAELLERAIHLAAHFDQAGHVRSLVARLDALLAKADDRTAPASALEPLLGQCFRGLRKLGLRDDADRLLERMADLILRGRGEATADGLASSAALTGPDAVVWGRTLRLLLHVAAGWSHNGQHDRARPIFDQARALLLTGDLPPIEQTALACGYARSLGQVPPEQALPRFDELFNRLERIHDTFTVGSHYSLSRLDVIEAVVLTLASDEFTLGEGGRRWLEDDEYLVRRRIHRDVRDALGQEA